jgi:hypothetical protein
MLELVRRAALVLLWLGVFLQVLFGLMPAGKVHTPRSTAPRSPARPWGFEARKVGKIGNRAYAVRVQLVAVSL